MPLLRLYCRVEQDFSDSLKLNAVDATAIKELCFYVECEQNLDEHQLARLYWILARNSAASEARRNETRLNGVCRNSTLPVETPENVLCFEVGPRLGVCTPFSTNTVAICRTIGLHSVIQVEKSRRYYITSPRPVSSTLKHQMIGTFYDRMTEMVYEFPPSSLLATTSPSSWSHVDVMKEHKQALQHANIELGLAFDERDIQLYYDLFCNKLARNPTTVECFDLAQSNSEHSRHWFFKGELVIDGVAISRSLLDMVMDTQKHSSSNNVIKFSDNASAIEGGVVTSLLAANLVTASQMHTLRSHRHLVFTAETHNFPTGVAPFSGACTGVGGRIRDVQAVGRGGHVMAGTAGYCVGNLLLPGNECHHEDRQWSYPKHLASCVHVLLEGSDGASDYGNKFGEPLVAGFCRSYGGRLNDGDNERREWIKPIMFSGGVGTVQADMIDKKAPTSGMLVVKIGGPAYRIGVGGGAASSVQVQGDSASQLDFQAVQRGDAEMEQKLNRVIRACIEHGVVCGVNPVASIHDQGAGGNGNVIKELVYPEGAIIYTDKFQRGDDSLSTLDLWSAEYQESNAVLCTRHDIQLLQEICQREKCPVCIVGEVTGDGRIVLREGRDQSADTQDPVNLALDDVLGKMPPKVFHDSVIQRETKKLELPILNLMHGNQTTQKTFLDILEKILGLPSVGSKRFLTNKVDRSVGGLVAQQQCVGPLHTPLADAAVLAVSHYDTWGVATSIGEQPIKCLLNGGAGARLSVAEAITNLAFVAVTRLNDVKCSVNWMWPAKLPGETAHLYYTCTALCDVMQQLGIAVDGGKDSLSMSARVDDVTVKAPGSVVVSTYVKCPDVRLSATPDLKCVNSQLLHVFFHDDPVESDDGLGGTALSHVLAQYDAGKTPDLHSAAKLSAAFNVTQTLLRDGRLLSGHDVSDGGALVCALEMAVSGVKSVQLNWTIDRQDLVWTCLMAEQPGWIIEVDNKHVESVMKMYIAAGVPCRSVGHVSDSDHHVTVTVNQCLLLDQPLSTIAVMWEQTSYLLEKLQAHGTCVDSEWSTVGKRQGPTYQLPPDFKMPLAPILTSQSRPLLAVIREEGTNGDREMAAAFDQAGFEVWDVTMSDVAANNACLERFRGIAFPGGFSYADVCGSGVGWAASITQNSTIYEQFERFRSRSDTFSLGVCNGCQLMAHLGWITAQTDGGADDHISRDQVRLLRNTSGRFESRFSTVKVSLDSKCVMLRHLRGSVLGVWVAHGEGRFSYNSARALDSLVQQGQVALQYVDDWGTATQQYPHNPNGSGMAVAGLCSMDGRHLAMMPHPERCIQPWQWPHKPRDWRLSPFSPWFRMFTSAYQWCTTHQQ